MRDRRSPPSQCQTGFTLVELMVALLVGLIVIAGIGQVFVHSKRASAVQDELARLQENGRYALSLLQEEILNAGYLGCGQAVSLGDSINSAGTYIDNFSLPLSGYEAVGNGWAPVLPTELGNAGGGIEPGTDVITIRYAEGTGLKMTQPKEAYLFQVANSTAGSTSCSDGANGYSGLCPNDLIIVSDCTKGRTARVESMNLIDGVLSINHSNPAWGQPGDPDPNNHFSPAYSYLFKAKTISYYIRVRDPATGVPSLYRKIGNGVAQELVEGVENMQVLYGEDSNGDKIPNRFLPASNITDFGRVVSIRVALLLRTIRERANRPAGEKTFQLLNVAVDTPDDRHIRKVFTTTIQLRNH